MATSTLQIQEYPANPKNDGWPIEPPSVQTALAIGSETDSVALAASTAWVRLSCDASCRVDFGTAPTAGANSMSLAAGYNNFHRVSPGSGLKVSVILLA